MLPIDRRLFFVVLAIVTGDATAADPQAGGKPGDAEARATWLYFDDAGVEGRFRKGPGKLWIEATTDGGECRFMEVERNAKSIELFDPTRSMWVRLFDDHADLRQGNLRSPWYGLYDGHWDKVDNAPKPKPARKPVHEKEKPAGDGDASQWQYKVLVASSDPAQTENALNNLGDEGWELTLADSKVTGQFSKGPDGAYHIMNNTTVQLILERPKRGATDWEYQVMVPSNDPQGLERALTRLGEQGWRLCLTVGRLSDQVLKGADGSFHPLAVTTVQFILKRPKD